MLAKLFVFLTIAVGITSAVPTYREDHSKIDVTKVMLMKRYSGNDSIVTDELLGKSEYRNYFPDRPKAKDPIFPSHEIDYKFVSESKSHFAPSKN